MGVLDGGGDRRRERLSFRGEFGASHCNQWGISDALFSNYFEDLFKIAQLLDNVNINHEKHYNESLCFTISSQLR